MKKVILLSLLLFSIIGFSQVITINNTRTDDDLVRNVLVNSPCVTIPPTITSSTGTNFGSTNGIGYFQNTNPAFPLSDGVVLSTGNAINSHGPNSIQLNDGSVTWPGDAQLQATLAAAGITMNSINASYIQFEFTSISTGFNFQFLYASEEYGNLQCQSTDGFAFLLTDTVTGITQNLAVIPGTTTPITAQTVRNNLYNSSCDSSNSSYFGNSNEGVNSASSPINYNGQTILMNAGASLVPNRLYRLKLVIADGLDTRDDSAIFIGGSSFDFTQDVLGPDLTIANGTALCNNNGNNISYTIISGLDPAIYTFIWLDSAGNPISGETGPNLTINSPGTYQISYFINGCPVETNDIVIEYQSSITTPDPVDLYKCSNGSPSYTFDLNYNTNIVNSSGNYTVSYHNLQLDANAGLSPQPTSYNIASGSIPREIWVRILDTATGCYTLKSFFLQLTPEPVLNNPGNQTRCETVSGSGTAVFDLVTLTNGILALQSSSIYNISYHVSGNDAINNTGVIDTALPLITGNTTIGIRIENITDPTCFSTVTIDLIVKPRPIIAIRPNQYVCIQYVLPPLPAGQQYWSGPNQTGTNWPVGTIINTDNTVVYIYAETGGSPNCPSQTSYTVYIIQQDDITPLPVNRCDSYTFEPYPTPGMQYFSMAGGPSTSGNIEYFPSASTITVIGTTTVHVYFTFTDPTCPPISSTFDINIFQTPTVSNTFTHIFDCTQISSLPPINSNIGTGNYYTFDGTTYTPLTFPVTTTTEVYAFAENNICRSAISQFTIFIGSLGFQPVNLCSGTYTLNTPAMGEFRDTPNGGGNIITTPQDYTSNATIYHYIYGASCTDDDVLTITFHQPTLTTQNDPQSCGSYLLPTNPDSGRYFRGQNGPGNGLTELIAGVNSITTTETIWIYKESTITQTPVCYNEIPWTITINTTPPIDPRGYVLECYSYTLAPLTNGQYYDNPYDPTGVIPHIPITDFVINVETDLNAEDDIPNRIKILYVANINPNDPNCYSESTFNVEFDAYPAFNQSEVYRCESFTLPPIYLPNTTIIDPNANYYDLPLDDTDPLTPHPGNIIPIGTQYNYSGTVNPLVIGPIYIHTSTINKKSCEDEKSFNITLFQTPTITPAIATINDNIYACNSYTLQPLTVGRYYTLSGGPNTTGNTEIMTPITYDINNPTPAVIYAYAQSGDTNVTCPVEQPITINIFNVTQLTNPPVGCGSLTLATLPALNPGENYYSSTGGSGLLNPNTPLNTTQTVFIYAVSPFGCSDETSFLVTITPTPVAFTNLIPIIDRTVCDEDVLNDGITSFNLTTLNAVILGTQTTPEYTIAYYESSANATAQLSPVTSTILTTVYVRVNNTLSLNCYDIKPITIIVNKVPDATLKSEYFICSDYESHTLLNFATLDTGLSTPNYSFVWTLDGASYGGNTGLITTNQIGTYKVMVTNTSTGCQTPLTAKVTLYEPYITFDYSDAFENPTYITVNVLGAGSGNYEYRLDEGPYQDSNVFYNVSPGEHKISVNDKDGNCNPAPIEAVIINYPKFFTPNGDGFHETWNILNLKTTNPNAPILIFDRFGKLIKQITPASDGWNGKYNGQPLPATDYWFTVDYTEKGASKVFKSHFALKR